MMQQPEIAAASRPRTGVARRELGRSGFAISELGLGCASFWAKPTFPEARARAVLAAALESGINVFDTGASYAAGNAERRLGRLLRELGQDPDMLFIATKAGSVSNARGKPVRDFRATSVIDQVKRSLQRLGLERLPLLQLHGPLVEELTDELLRALERLRDQGRIGLLGVNGSAQTIRHALDIPAFDVVMPFFSVREPANRGLVEAAAESGRGVLVAGPLARMTFAPPLLEWLRRPSGLWYLARILRHGAGSMVRTGGLNKALVHSRWTPAQLAMRWVLDHPGVSSAIFGTTRPRHVHELAQCSSMTLPAPVRRALKKIHAGPV